MFQQGPFEHFDQWIFFLFSIKYQNMFQALRKVAVMFDKWKPFMWWLMSLASSPAPLVVASFVLIACTGHNTTSIPQCSVPQYLHPSTCEDAVFISYLYPPVRIFKTDLVHILHAVRLEIGEDGQWTFPATGQVTCFPIVRQRLIPGRLQK